jgi:Na+-driven multidrug efflux pump
MNIKQTFFRVFTSDKEVISQAMEVATVVALGFFPDYWQATLSGCVRALGIQQKAIKYNLFAFWIVNTSLITILAFKL